jgi:hypothetical protein
MAGAAHAGPTAAERACRFERGGFDIGIFLSPQSYGPLADNRGPDFLSRRTMDAGTHRLTRSAAATRSKPPPDLSFRIPAAYPLFEVEHLGLRAEPEAQEELQPQCSASDGRLGLMRARRPPSAGPKGEARSPRDCEIV